MIVGADGQTTLSVETVEFGGFKLNKASLQNNPIELMIVLSCLNLNDLQKEFLTKVGVVLTDIDGKKIFPMEEDVED